MTLSFVLPNLLTWDGDRLMVGGLERFAWALLEVARKVGYVVDVHQNGSSDWVREVAGVPIYGHGLARLSPLAAWESIHHDTVRTLYLSIAEEVMSYRPRSLIVSHGVWWDEAGADVNAQLNACRHALEQADLVVSVDYNFQNVMRATYPALSHKIEVIPNFADTDRFTPPAEDRPDRCTVLFPRRIDPGRGLDLFLAAMGPVLTEFPSVRITMAVDNNQAFTTLVERFRSRTDEPALARRVDVTTASFDDMPDVYRAADIVVIPPTHGEGTAFGCLEAMAAGRAVVATDIGGLTNLIVPGFNGLLVPPRKEALSRAIRTLVMDPGLRRDLGRHARDTALALNRARWEDAWANALMRVYGYPVA
jgi:glycosyltransferase involved in cell wall biosynthesis